ncbi:hypothetical protein KTE54_03025 [Burkholderia multivorans]|uniref:hypothetical protein n=1 Tax=Burkholderia multivorans TaxID=87883 RepID=UPI001C2744F6|nr:hypothetical protein [Burkholderia multivorans]MBU9559655.1 hypothetical protein [Burkholderia multivorans]
MSIPSKYIDHLSEFARNVVDSLKAEGFEVEASPAGENALRVTWRNVWIGVMEKALCNQKRSPTACTYRFPKHGPCSTIAAVPNGFDKEDFARAHGCDPEMLSVDS